MLYENRDISISIGIVRLLNNEGWLDQYVYLTRNLG